MSYLRSLSPYIYVDGISKDYIFETGNKKESWIQDYGSISNESIVELLFRFAKEQDNEFKLILFQMALRLSENLNIKLRKKPLSLKQWFELSKKTHEEYSQMFEDYENSYSRGENGKYHANSLLSK